MIDLTKKKILVTGSGGFLGSHCVEALLRHGVPKENIFPPRSHEVDLRNLDAITKAVAGINIIFDFAGSLGGDLIYRSEHAEEIYRDNMMMGTNIISAAAVSGVEKVITLGSIAEYPEAAPIPLREEDLLNGPVAPVNLAYGMAKRAVLAAGQAARAEHGLNAVHLLMTNIYGPRERAENGYVMTSLIRKVLSAMDAGETFVDVWGTGDALRDFLYVDDAMEIILEIAEKYDKGDPMNVGSGSPVTIKKLVETICRLTEFTGKVQVKPRFDPSKPEGQKNRTLDVSRMNKVVTYKPVTSLDAGIAKTIAWHRENK